MKNILTKYSDRVANSLLFWIPAGVVPAGLLWFQFEYVLPPPASNLQALLCLMVAAEMLLFALSITATAHLHRTPAGHIDSFPRTHRSQAIALFRWWCVGAMLFVVTSVVFELLTITTGVGRQGWVQTSQRLFLIFAGLGVGSALGASRQSDG